MSQLGFGIDRGGTFTDVFVVYPDGTQETFKLLSEDKNNYEDAPTGWLITTPFKHYLKYRSYSSNSESVYWQRD